MLFFDVVNFCWVIKFLFEKNLGNFFKGVSLKVWLLSKNNVVGVKKFLYEM